MDAFDRAALAAVAEAGQRLRHTWRERKVIEHKGVIDIVTESDREIEALISGHLHAAFPDHLIIGEEASVGVKLQPPPEDRYAWYLDPIDGTTNFAHAYPNFAVSLGLARGRERLLAIVHDPVRDETFVARRGAGATLNGEPIRVSDTDDIEQALVGTGFPYDRREHIDFYLRFLRAFMVRAQGVRRSGSAALDLCYVACGRFDGFWEWKLKPWDIAAGVLIIEEAGGTVTNFDGDPLDLFGEQTLASNGRLHAAMIDILATQRGAQT